MKYGLFKRAAAVAAAMMLTLASVMTVSAAPDVKIVEKDSKVTLHLYGSNSSSNDLSTGTAADVSKLPSDAEPLAGATFQYGEVGAVVQYSDGKETGIRFKITSQEFASALEIGAQDAVFSDGAYYVVPEVLQRKLADNTSSATAQQLIKKLQGICTQTTGETDAQGTVTVENLNGLYVFIGGTMPKEVTSQVTPFIVAAPMPNLTGDGWNSDIHVYPKVTNNEVKLSKTAAQGGTPSVSTLVQSGQAIQYEVKAVIPGGASVGAIADFEQFVIKDTMAAGLTPVVGKSSLVIKDSKGQEHSFTVKEDATGNRDIVVTPPTQENLYATTVTFTATGLEKLNTILKDGDADITLKYEAILGAGAALGHTGNRNVATIEYKRENISSSSVETNSTVYTYGIDVTKKLSDNAAVEGGTIKFKMSRLNEGGDAYGEMSFTQAANGTYWVVGDNNDMKDAQTTTELTVQEDGSLKIFGLLPGTYQLEETKSANGYSLLDKPISIVITAPNANSYNSVNATATADGQSMETNAANAFKLTVVNTKQTTGFTLPQTGGAGMIAALAVGFGLVCFAVVTLIFYRTKNRNTDAQ